MKKFDIEFVKIVLENINDLRFFAGEKLYYHLKAFEDLGLTKYKKRNYENWAYWWFQVDTTKQRPNRNDFTADLTAFEISYKGYNFLKMLNENLGYNFATLYQKISNEIETNSVEYFLDLRKFMGNK